MRPFKLGLSRPKSKKNDGNEIDDKSESKMDISQIDEINVSRETIGDISDSHLRRVVKAEPESILDKSIHSVAGDVSKRGVAIESILDLVNKVTINHNKHLQPGAAENYDLQNKYEPKPGPSNIKVNYSLHQSFNDSDKDIESSPETDKLGIMSFYNMSKVFDISLEDNNIDKMPGESQKYIKTEHCENKHKEDKLKNIGFNFTDVKMKPNESHSKETKVKIEPSVRSFANKEFEILTPRIKPPTKSYVCSSLLQYNIPKVRNPEPYYSDHTDVGDKVEIGQMVLKINSKLSRDQKPFEKVLVATSIEEWRHLLFLQTNEMSQESSKPDALKLLLAGNRKCVLEPVKKPPTSEEIKRWLMNKDTEVKNDDNATNNVDISKNIDELENSQALGLNEIDNSISLETVEVSAVSIILKQTFVVVIFIINCFMQEKANLNNSLQITMQHDGSFLCFGSNVNKPESSSIGTCIIDVSIQLNYDFAPLFAQS